MVAKAVFALACAAALATQSALCDTVRDPPDAEDPLAFRFPMGGRAVAGPFAAAGAFWLVSEDRNLYVVSAQGRAVGRRVWVAAQAAAQAAAWAAPHAPPAWAVTDPYDRVAMPSGPARIDVMDRFGRSVFAVETIDPIVAPPAFGADGRMFVPTAGGLRAFAANGTPLWSAHAAQHAQTFGPVTGDLVDDGGATVAAVAWRAGDGAVSVWTMSGRALFRVAGPGNAAAVATAGGRLFVAFRDGALTVRSGSGTELARGALPGPPMAMVAGSGTAAGADVFGITTDGMVFRAGADGRVRWRTATGLGAPTGLSAFAERITVPSRGGATSLSLDGEIFRELSIRNADGAPALDAAGLAASAGADWILYAYRFERPMTPPARACAPSVTAQAISDRLAEELAWIRTDAYADAMSVRLDDIEKTLGSGSIGEGEDEARLLLLAVASTLSLPAVHGPAGTRPVGAVTNPLPRVRACGMLGRLGSPATVEALTRVFRADPEPVVRAAAADAIAAIGLDPDGTAFAAFDQASRDAFVDEETAAAVMRAVERLYRSGSRPDDPAGVRAVLRLANQPYPAAIRRLAEAVLGRLMRR